MIFRQLVDSYRDLPLRLAEAGMTYRKELSGVTYGLIRVKGFAQNDAHLYVTQDQLREEFKKVIQLLKEVYAVMGITGYWFRLSLADFTNPEKFIGDAKEWEFAAKEIQAAMKELGEKYVEGKGEAAFYGPKIDVQIRNSSGKEETIATSQVDIVVPKRLGLVYTDKDDARHHVIIIHRAVLGSYERFIAYLLEQTKGNLPLWLSPVQVKVISFTDRNAKAAAAFADELARRGIRAETDARKHTVEYKIRDAEMERVPYMVVIGDKEEKNHTLAVRKRGDRKPEFGVKREDFIRAVLKESMEKK
jgi:threonyl-tRNA synthetase